MARVAITGAAGQLGRQLVRAVTDAGDEVLALSRPGFDITDTSHLARLTAWRPDVVVNTAAWTDVDGCARDPDRAMRINGEAAGAVARAAADGGGLIVQVSTNEVFDGTLNRPYTEKDEVNPINPYGASKLAGERLVARSNARHLIVRTAWIFSADSGFPVKIRAAADRMHEAGQPLRVVADEWGNPTSAAWLAQAILSLADLETSTTAAAGVYHVAGEPPTTRLSWARHVLDGHPVTIEPITLQDYTRDSRVPPRAVLDMSRVSSYGIAIGDWRAGDSARLTPR